MAAALLLSPVAAAAQGYSLDPELLQSSFSYRAMPGMDAPQIPAEGGVRAGTTLQYEHEPLVLYMGENPVAVVSHRSDAQLGFAYDWNERFSTRVVMPLTFQSEGEVPELTAGGFGMRDLRVGGRFAITTSGPLYITARGDVSLPSGKRDAYLGESTARADLGFLGGALLGPIELLVDAGFTGRPMADTGYDLQLGSEFVANLGLRHSLADDRLAVGAMAISRTGARVELDNSGTRAELLGLVQLWPTSSLQVDLGIGSGLTKGYGTSSGRALAGVTWMRPLPSEYDDLELVSTHLPEQDWESQRPTLEEDLPEEDITWKHGELARVEAEDQHIAIRDDIRFEVGTARILPESLPILDAIAELMASYWQIDHLLVEGHASEEGSYSYNFDLSMDRARSIYKALVEAGVHPDRLSFRAFGEVQAAAADSSEEQLAADRRVEFQIVQQLDPLDPPPTYPDQVLLPWTGEAVLVRQASERLVGQEIDFTTPVGPDEDEQTLDLLNSYLHDEEPEEELSFPDPPTPPEPSPQDEELDAFDALPEADEEEESP